MPKANALSKAKSTDCQATEVSADASNISFTMSDKTYAIYKELCKEMSKSVCAALTNVLTDRLTYKPV